GRSSSLLRLRGRGRGGGGADPVGAHGVAAHGVLGARRGRSRPRRPGAVRRLRPPTDRLERLINLIAALLEAERPLTSEELHQRLPGYAENQAAFRRSFERDKDALREMGIPLALEAVDASQPHLEGYRIPKDEYYL